MKPSTAAILRIIALAMLFFTVGSLIYALFVPQYNGLQILGFPQTYRQSYILRCCYPCVMVLLFALTFSAGSRAKRSRLNTVFSSTRYGLFVLILSIQTASLVLITPQQYHILRSIIALLCVVLTAGLLAALITMVREKTYDLCLLSECAGVLISLALYWVQVNDPFSNLAKYNAIGRTLAVVSSRFLPRYLHRFRKPLKRDIPLV